MGLLLGGIVPMFGETNANGEVLVDLYQWNFQNIILAPSNSKAVWNTQYSEVELGPFENITFLGPDPCPWWGTLRRKGCRCMQIRRRWQKSQGKEEWRGSGSGSGSGQWAVGSGTPHENETVERGGNCWKSLYKEAQYLSGITWLYILLLCLCHQYKLASTCFTPIIIIAWANNEERGVLYKKDSRRRADEIMKRQLLMRAPKK